MRFFFNVTATPGIYTLSLHDALPILLSVGAAEALPRSTGPSVSNCRALTRSLNIAGPWSLPARSEEHTSELQSRRDLVCRLLLEKKKSLGTLSAASCKPSYFRSSVAV